MKIVIAGAGDMGFHLARLLSVEAQDIVLIDTNQDVLDYAQSHLDVGVLRGNSSSMKVLKEANVHAADIVLAVSNSEPTNIVTAILSKKMGAKKTIARITNQEYLLPQHKQYFQELGIDSLISPRQLAAKEIVRLIDEAAVTDIFEFENGKLCLIGIFLDENSSIINKSINETASLNPDLSFIPIAFQRGAKTIIPRGDSIFKLHDHIFFITQKDSIERIISLTGKQRKKVRNVMILGGSSIGVLAASMLEDRYNVKLIEKSRSLCLDYAEELKETLVVNADGNDVEALEEEGLAEMDVFVAVTLNSETNIISSLVAKNHNVYKTIALVENVDYINLSQSVGVDTLINRKLIAANNVFRHVRKGEVEDIASMHGVNAEVIEFSAVSESKITKKPIRDLNFPKDAIIGGVIRGEDSFIPLGEFQIREGDKVVVFVLPSAISKVEALFNR